MQHKAPALVVVGSANTDMIIQLDHLPRPGETLLGGTFSTAAGGKGANQAVAAARAGGRVALVACVGRDTLGREALAGYRRDRINTTHVRRDPVQPSGVALIFVARGGENCIAVAPGANHQLTSADVARAESAIAGARAVLLQLEIPLAAVRAALRLARRHRVPVILNPAPAQPLPRALLSQIDLLTPNETEAELLTGIRVRQPASAIRAARALRAQGVGTVILTLGARGALVATSEGEELVPGFKVKAVDTTAAGDVFNGALAVALGEGRPLVAATRFACAAAALSVTRLGAQPSAPTRKEIEAQVRQGKG
jgi:ribokinase